MSVTLLSHLYIFRKNIFSDTQYLEARFAFGVTNITGDGVTEGRKEAAK
jgi:hypothetical protein